MSAGYFAQWLYRLSILAKTLSKEVLAVISDLNLRDEYASLEPKALLREVAKILAKNEVKVILLVDKSQREVVGIMTEQRFLQACATGVDPAKTPASKFMSTNVLRLLSDTPIQIARNLIDKHQPDAVIALNPDRKFRGYLSPADYRQLETPTSLFEEEGEEEHDEEEAIDTSSPDSNLTINFHVSHDGSGIGNIYSDECPGGDPKVVGRWGPVFQETIWKIIQELAKEQLKGKEEIAAYSIGESGLSIHTNQSADQFEISLDDLLQELRIELGGGQEGPVIWVEDGSEILLYNFQITAESSDGTLSVDLPIFCDQIMTEQKSRQVIN
tara:strand:- start:627 stop:1610 length:984 start_codon:yes stop_codon:yes gene_type:complete